MIRLFRAGFVGGCIQLGAVGLETIISNFSGGIECQPASAVFFLPWCYLVTAFGAALTTGRFVTTTTAHIRRASRAVHPIQPNLTTKILLAQLYLASLGFGVLVLRPPPYFLVAVCDYVGFACGASIVWSGLMSIGAASFGANAQATRRAL